MFLSMPRISGNPSEGRGPGQWTHSLSSLVSQGVPASSAYLGRLAALHAAAVEARSLAAVSGPSLLTEYSSFEATAEPQWPAAAGSSLVIHGQQEQLTGPSAKMRTVEPNFRIASEPIGKMIPASQSAASQQVLHRLASRRTPRASHADPTTAAADPPATGTPRPAMAAFRPAPQQRPGTAGRSPGRPGSAPVLRSSQGHLHLHQASPRQPHAAILDAHSTAARQRLQAGSADGAVERRVASQRPAYKLAAPVAAMLGKGQAPGAEEASPGLIIRGLKRPRSAAELRGAGAPAAAAAAAWQLHAEGSQTEGVQSPRTPSLAATTRRGLSMRPQSASPRARVPAKPAGSATARHRSPSLALSGPLDFTVLAGHITPREQENEDPVPERPPSARQLRQDSARGQPVMPASFKATSFLRQGPLTLQTPRAMPATPTVADLRDRADQAADTLPNRLLAGIMQQCMPSGSQAQQAADAFTCCDVGQGPDVQHQVQAALQPTPRAGVRPKSAPPAGLARRTPAAGAAAGEGVEPPGRPSLVEEPACLPQAAVPKGRLRVRPNSASVGKSNHAPAGARAMGIADMDQAWTTT